MRTALLPPLGRPAPHYAREHEPGFGDVHRREVGVAGFGGAVGIAEKLSGARAL